MNENNLDAFLDKDGLIFLSEKIKSSLALKVDKVDGKGLSSNDFTSADKAKLDSLSKEIDWGNITGKPDLALKSDLTMIYRYKGIKPTFESLPTSGMEIGDVWDTEDTNMNYAWNGEKWDPLGQVFKIRAITNEEIDAIVNGG